MASAFTAILRKIAKNHKIIDGLYVLLYNFVICQVFIKQNKKRRGLKS